MFRATTSVRHVVLVGLLLSLAVGSHTSVAEDSEDARLGLTKSNNALPIWTSPTDESRSQLGDAAKELLQGVMLVGHPDVGHGTAWVLSRENRLLATNAHVADMMAKGKPMMAITNESTTIYDVENVWYHPGVRRCFEGAESLSVLSTDPDDGPVFPLCPDLAILEISDEGPDLPTEFPMAAPEEVAGLLGQATAIFGYPGHDTDWPRLGESPVATLHQGVVSRLTDFHNGTASERQQLQYTMATWSGFSGSPVFLPNGHVVAIHNMGRTVESNSGVLSSIAHGVRVDCLWELIVHHDLEDKVPFDIDETQLDIERWLHKDERDVLAERVQKLVDEAAYFVYTTQEFSKAAKKCSQAIELVPDYARAYYIRSGSFTNYWLNNEHRISRDAAFQQLQYAFNDSKKYCQLNPTDPLGVIDMARCNSNFGFHFNGSAEHYRRSLSILNDLLTSENLTTYVNAAALASRGICHGALGMDQAGLNDFNEAIRLCPNIPEFWRKRAQHLENRGQTAAAQADYAKEKELRDADLR